MNHLEILPESADAGAPVCVRHRVLTTAAPVCGWHVVRVTVFHVEKTDISTGKFNLNLKSLRQLFTQASTGNKVT